MKKLDSYFGPNYMGPSWHIHHDDNFETTQVYLEDHTGILDNYVQWCSEHCNHKWGWYFYYDGKAIRAKPVIRFESKQEAIEFKLYCL